MIKEGSTVRLVYTGTLDDGTVFGYAKPEAPMEFQTGMDLTIDGFEREISQMEAGEKKTFTLGIYDAYGEYLDHLVEAVPVEYVPLKNVEVGMRVQMTGENGEKIPVTIKDITSKEIIFDMNHPLAGKELTFEVEILSVEEPPEGWHLCHLRSTVSIHTVCNRRALIEIIKKAPVCEGVFSFFNYNRKYSVLFNTK